MIHRIPLPECPGKLFTSPMPYRYDQGELLDRAHTEGVSWVVMLVSDEEAQEKCGRDLRQDYARRGLQVIHHPIEDLDAPLDLGLFRHHVQAAADALRNGRALLVHCAAGIGRTGLFVTCLVALLRHISAEDAIAVIRTSIRGAVETEQQCRFVRALLAAPPESATA
jgi:protein-tyrosine phosphatase